MSTKIAIIGAGGMAGYHASGFRQAGAEIVALCDVNQAAADRAAAKHQIGRVFTDVTAMLKAVPANARPPLAPALNWNDDGD